MTPTPKSKLTQILADLHGCEIDGPEDCPAVQEALPQIVSLLRELVPESPNWKTDPEAKVYAEGFAACREQMLKNLEGLWAK